MRGSHPPRADVAHRLNGLGDIISQIWRETGIRFNTYADEPDDLFEDDALLPAEADDDWIEDPSRNPLWAPDTD